MISKQKMLTIDGKDIFVFTLKNAGGNTAAVTNYGGTVMQILVPDRNGKLADVVLGFDSVQEYLNNNPFMGSTVGRYANRIANGTFVLNGKEYRLECNESPFSHLHGGNSGFDKKVWDAEIKEDKLILTYISADGEEGYPGNLSAHVTFSWNDDNELSIEYEASSDKDTIINLTNHSYFNLNGGASDILNHELTLSSTSLTPVDGHLIPTGEIMPAANTPFDFAAPHKIGERIGSSHPQMLAGHGYDHNFVIDGKGMRFAARVFDEDSGRMLEVYTDQPGAQVYTANFLGDVSGKKQYHDRWGICIETQNYPDAVNHENFPSCVLKKGGKYHTTTKFHFSARR
jgi:aldose 1-epimerase